MGKPRASRKKKAPSKAVAERPNRCEAPARSKIKRGLSGEAARCSKTAEPGSRYCAKHRVGGRPPTNGRYATFGERFGPAIQASLADAELFDLRYPVAVLDAATKRLVGRTIEGDTPEVRAAALAHIQEARQRAAAKDRKGFEASFSAAERVLEQGVEEDRELRQVVDFAERTARRIEGVWDVKLRTAAVVNGQDLQAIIARLVDIVGIELLSVPEVRERVLSRLDAELLPDERTLGPRTVEVESG